MTLRGELSRRKQSAWSAFWKLQDILLNRTISQKTKTHIYNTHVLPAMLYAAETWTTTKRDEESLLTTQRAMERKMLNIRLNDQIPNTEIRRRTGVEDVVKAMYSSERRWAGHVARMEDNRWTIRVTEWRPRNYKRPQGRPPTRWTDPMVKILGRTWNRIARCRSTWRGCDLRCWRACS